MLTWYSTAPSRTDVDTGGHSDTESHRHSNIYSGADDNSANNTNTGSSRCDSNRDPITDRNTDDHTE